MEEDLSRFLEAQKHSYGTALEEIREGKKTSHWMWYIFPQIQGLGISSTARYYAIQNLDEAKAYLKDPVLGRRLEEICQALLELESNDAFEIFGSPDCMKLRSSMTLFAAAAEKGWLFERVLEKFFHGERDKRTETILQSQRKK